MALLWWVCADWLFDWGRGGTAVKAVKLAGLAVAMPLLWAWWLAGEAVRRVRAGPLAHEPTL
jgi:hypothetical protein